MAVAGYVALAGGLGTLALLILAVRMFKTAETGGVVLSACVCAALPFVVTWLLSVNGTRSTCTDLPFSVSSSMRSDHVFAQ